MKHMTLVDQVLFHLRQAQRLLDLPVPDDATAAQREDRDAVAGFVGQAIGVFGPGTQLRGPRDIHPDQRTSEETH